jgi:hypothetical protein
VSNDRSLHLQLSDDEIVMLNNCLNEICNGVHIEDWEFQTRVGWSRAEVQKLLSRINAKASDVF